MSDELKPCPFCSSTDIVLRHGHGTHFVDCDDCGASGPVYATEAACVEGWNEVPRTAEQQEETRDDDIEGAYWNFDNRKKRRDAPQSERDAFKWAVRDMLAKLQQSDNSAAAE